MMSRETVRRRRIAFREAKDLAGSFDNHTGRLHAAELRQIAARTHEGDAARRMLAVAHAMDGRSHGEAAALCGMDRQILRDWVHRYDGEGQAF